MARGKLHHLGGEPTLKQASRAAKARDLKANVARMVTLLSWIEGQAGFALAAIEKGQSDNAAHYTSQVVRNAKCVERLIKESE